MTKQIPLIILAAGASTRLGTPKQLLRYGEQSLLLHSAQTALASVCEPVIIVLGAYAELLKPQVANLPVQVVENPNWQAGMGTSICTGMNTINTYHNIDAVALMLCDQPLVRVEVINKLVEVFRLKKSLIVASEYEESLGVPALFSSALFNELAILKGATGARGIISKYCNQVEAVSFADGAIDIDTPSDYQQFLELVK
jgi:molybdenum cofactor cytidylyltransferase